MNDNMIECPKCGNVQPSTSGRCFKCGFDLSLYLEKVRNKAEVNPNNPEYFYEISPQWKEYLKREKKNTDKGHIKIIGVVISAVIIGILIIIVLSTSLFEKIFKKSTSSESEIKYSLQIYDPSTISYIQRDGVYKGDLSNGVPNGHGLFTTQNLLGDTYTIVGDFTNGKLDGFSTTNYPTSGQRFETKYNAGVFLEGTLYNKDVLTYEFVLHNEKKLYIVYHQESQKTIQHYSEDGMLEKSTVVDALYSLPAVAYNEFKGFNISLDSVMYINDTLDKTNTAIKQLSEKKYWRELSNNLDNYLHSIICIENPIIYECISTDVNYVNSDVKTITTAMASLNDCAFILFYNGNLSKTDFENKKVFFTPFCTVESAEAFSNAKGIAGYVYFVE